MSTDRRKTERGREFIVKVMHCVCTSLLRNSWGAEEPERGGLKQELSVSCTFFALQSSPEPSSAGGLRVPDRCGPGARWSHPHLGQSRFGVAAHEARGCSLCNLVGSKMLFPLRLQKEEKWVSGYPEVWSNLEQNTGILQRDVHGFAFFLSYKPGAALQNILLCCLPIKTMVCLSYSQGTLEFFISL